VIERFPAGDVTLSVQQLGTGPPLLLVHGFPLDHTMWTGQAAELAQAWRVIAPDLRGFGRSQVVPGTATMSQLADDLARLLDTLQITGPVTYCGLSMGGYIAWQFWRRHRERLARLVLCDTRAVADTPEVARGRQLVADQVLAEGARVAADAMLGRLFSDHTRQQQPQLVDQTRQVILATDPQGIAAAQRGMAQRPDVTTWLPEIAVPTLVVCGAHDAISGPAEMQAIARAIPGARYAELPDAGHMAPLESAAGFNAALRSFLAG